MHNGVEQKQNVAFSIKKVSMKHQNYGCNQFERLSQSSRKS